MVTETKTPAPISFPAALLALIKFAAKAGGFRSRLEPLQVEISKDGHCTMVATNGHVLAFAELAGDHHGPERSFGIRQSAVISAMKLRPQGTIHVNPERLTFQHKKTSTEVAFGYHPTDGDYPDWRALIDPDAEDEKIAAFDPAYMKQIGDLAVKLAPKGYGALIIDRIRHLTANIWRLEVPINGLAKVEFILMPRRSNEVEEKVSG